MYMASVRAARRFLAGMDTDPLQKLAQAMADASRVEEFERAAVLRDKLQILTWLTTCLERLRQARANMSFIYPVSGKTGQTLWYLIHAARPVKVIEAPGDHSSTKTVRTAIQAVFNTPSADLLDSHEHVDGMMLVMAWFRKYPKEMKKTLTVEEALAKCR